MAESLKVPEQVSLDTVSKRYRILLPLDRVGRRPGMLQFALSLANAFHGEVIALHVITPDDPLGGEEWELPAVDAEYLAQVPHQVVTYRAESIASGILEVARREACNLILLNWHGQPPDLRHKLGSILDPVVEEAPCDVALLKGGYAHEGGAVPAQRVLVATAGGFHAVGAARLALALARYCKGRVSLITILGRGAKAKEEAAAHKILDDLVEETCKEDEESRKLIDRRVIRADKVEPAIVEAAKGHDMVFLGDTSTSVMTQLVVGSVIERLARTIPVPVVIVKRYGGFTHFWLRRIWRQVDRVLPSISAEEQLDVYKRIRRGARGTVDFFTLMLLSVVIATMGLLLDSGAVIIGAMLVAPLMTPILAIGLSVVMGDARLLRLAVRTTLQGITLAVGISSLLTWLAPLAIFTTEIAGRTQPNLFDLTVALAAGGAGAYSVSRRNVAAALPGVAIAAALVPPLSVVGISLATSRWEAAGGAMLLFSTNLIAISLAAATTYLLLGFFPEEEERSRHMLLRRGFLVILLLLFLVTVPLNRRLEQAVDEATRARLQQIVRVTLDETLSEEDGILLANYETNVLPGARSGEPLIVRVVVYSERTVTSELLKRMDERVTQAVGREVDLRMVIIPIDELREERAVGPENSAETPAETPETPR